MDSNYIIVSDGFCKIYKYLYVFDQTKNIKKLPRKERLLLIYLSLNAYQSTLTDQDRDEFFSITLPNFSEELYTILDFDLHGKIDPDLNSIIEELKSKPVGSIRQSSLRDQRGEPLYSPISGEDAKIKRRDYNLSKLI